MSQCAIESEVQVVFRRWHPQAGEQPYPVQPCSPAQGIAPCLTGLAFFPGRPHSAGMSSEGPVLSLQLDEEQKGGDGMSRFKPGVHLSVFCGLLGWDVEEIMRGCTLVS